MSADSDSHTHEEYRELLEALRTTIPGAQVLFAFLLTAPFASRFEQVDSIGKVVFFVSLAAVSIAIVLLLAPIAYHRVIDAAGRGVRLRFSVKTTLVALSLLGVSITSAVFVVTRFLFANSALAGFAASAVAGMAIILWWIVPLRSWTTLSASRNRH